MGYILLMDPPCPPFSSCWCQSHPTHKKCNPNTNVPINGGISFLVLAGLLLGIWYYKNI